jgi:ABC-type proline/glycine betaine transport system permease subunit
MNINYKRWFKLPLIIFGGIWGIGSVLIGDIVVDVLNWIEKFMNIIFEGLIWLIAFPAKFLNTIGITGPKWLVYLLAFSIAWFLSIYVIKIFNWFTHILYNKKFFKEN